MKWKLNLCDFRGPNESFTIHLNAVSHINYMAYLTGISCKSDVISKNRNSQQNHYKYQIYIYYIVDSQPHMFNNEIPNYRITVSIKLYTFLHKLKDKTLQRCIPVGRTTTYNHLINCLMCFENMHIWVWMISSNDPAYICAKYSVLIVSLFSYTNTNCNKQIFDHMLLYVYPYIVISIYTNSPLKWHISLLLVQYVRHSFPDLIHYSVQCIPFYKYHHSWHYS